MSKIVLPDVPAGYGLRDAVNNNFSQIEQMINDQLLSRDNPTESPNQMNEDLDMNTNDILNAGIIQAEDIYLPAYGTNLIEIVSQFYESASEKADEAGQSAQDSAQSAIESEEAREASEIIMNNMGLALEDFDSKYLGAHSTPPTVDNSGNALLEGALYYDSVSKSMFFWNGLEWDSIQESADVVLRTLLANTTGTTNTGGDFVGYKDGHSVSHKLDALDVGKMNVPIRIAIISDSLSTENILEPDSWPRMLEMYLNQSSPRDYKVYNFSRNGQSSLDARTEVAFGGMTASQACAASKPDMVIVGMDANDISSTLSTGTVATATADMTALVNELRASLPDVPIVKLHFRWHDSTHVSTANISTNLRNVTVCPHWWTRNTSGVYNGLIGTMIELVDSSAAIKSKISNTITFQTNINSIFDGNITADVFKIARLGGIGTDLLHFNKTGRMLFASYVLKGLKGLSSPLFETVADKGHSWHDPDDFFASQLTNSGSVWTPKTTFDDAAEQAIYDDLFGSKVELRHWMTSYKPSISVQNFPVDFSKGFPAHHISLEGLRRDSDVSMSNTSSPTSWSSPGWKTDNRGSMLIGVPSVLYSDNTTYYFRVKVGNDVYGPYTQKFVPA